LRITSFDSMVAKLVHGLLVCCVVVEAATAEVGSECENREVVKVSSMGAGRIADSEVRWREA
jgi:hypothetical protein